MHDWVITRSEPQFGIGSFVIEAITSLQTDKLVGDDATGHRTQNSTIRQGILGQHASEKVQMSPVTAYNYKQFYDRRIKKQQ